MRIPNTCMIEIITILNSIKQYRCTQKETTNTVFYLEFLFLNENREAILTQ